MRPLSRPNSTSHSHGSHGSHGDLTASSHDPVVRLPVPRQDRPGAEAARILDGVTADALDTEYENGVADVLAYVAGDASVVERNDLKPVMKSGRRRQLDVRSLGLYSAPATPPWWVDCKRYTTRLDVNHIKAFVGLVEDVGTDFGLLVNTVEVSPAASW